MPLMCRQCGFESPISSIFCERCRSSLRYVTSHDLTVKDFVTDGDRQALAALKATGLLLHLLYATVVEPRLKHLTTGISSKSPNPNPKIASLAGECADLLALDRLPTVCLNDTGQQNAFTTGSDSNPIIVIDQSLSTRLSDEELSSLLGHEMGHIKSRHLMYHSIAEVIGQGITFSSSYLGLGLVSIPLRLALLSWHRESEFSADRASLIASGDFISVARMFVKLVGEPAITNSNTSLNSFLENLQSHPTHLNRLKALRDFADSAQYSAITKKLHRRKILRQAFAVTCRFCGSPKMVEEVFCPKCGRSLA